MQRVPLLHRLSRGRRAWPVDMLLRYRRNIDDIRAVDATAQFKPPWTGRRARRVSV